jgi:hypothetical protein
MLFPIDKLTKYVPLATETVAPGAAASIAAWIVG